MLTPPLETVYVVKLGSRKPRTYTTMGAARGQITANAETDFTPNGKRERRFRVDCELWQVDEHGWLRLFRGEAGELQGSIPWETTFEARQKAADRQRSSWEEQKRREEIALLKQLQERYPEMVSPV